jgi:hypothetical protein
MLNQYEASGAPPALTGLFCFPIPTPYGVG